MRTDLPVDRDALAAAVNALPAPPPEVLERLNRPPADVVPLTARRDQARKAGAEPADRRTSTVRVTPELRRLVPRH